MTDFTNRAYRDGWMDAIKAVNEQAVAGMADAIREARAQVLRDVAEQIRTSSRSIYEQGSRQCSDDWGNDEKTIDGWYADYLDNLANHIEKGEA